MNTEIERKARDVLFDMLVPPGFPKPWIHHVSLSLATLDHIARFRFISRNSLSALDTYDFSRDMIESLGQSFMLIKKEKDDYASFSITIELLHDIMRWLIAKLKTESYKFFLEEYEEEHGLWDGEGCPTDDAFITDRIEALKHTLKDFEARIKEAWLSVPVYRRYSCETRKENEVI